MPPIICVLSRKFLFLLIPLIYSDAYSEYSKTIRLEKIFGYFNQSRVAPESISSFLHVSPILLNTTKMLFLAFYLRLESKGDSIWSQIYSSRKSNVMKMWKLFFILFFQHDFCNNEYFKIPWKNVKAGWKYDSVS